MAFTNKYTQILMIKFSNFTNSVALRETIELYSDGVSISIYTIFTGLTNYVVEELIKKITKSL